MATPKKNRGLGRGLDALFGSAEVSFDPPAEQKEDTNETVEKTAVKKEETNLHQYQNLRKQMMKQIQRITA